MFCFGDSRKIIKEALKATTEEKKRLLGFAKKKKKKNFCISAFAAYKHSKRNMPKH